jgi:outer membrane protein insertion porin family
VQIQRRARFLSWLAPLLFSPALAFASFSNDLLKELKNYAGKNVTEMQVLGQRRIEVDAVLQKLTTKKGVGLNLEDVRRDVQAIHAMGYFDEVEVRGERTDAGVKLLYRVGERPAIAEIEFDGNENIATKDLRDVIKVRQWSILDINKVREDTALIQKHYEDRGFYLAKISYEIEWVQDAKKEKPDEVRITYKIRDYDKVQIKRITFLNNTRFTDEQLKNTFAETKEGGFWSFLSSSGNFKESAFRQDLQRLTYWYLEHGYLKFRFENPVVTVSEDKRWLFISVYVEEGEQYRIGDIDFSGDLLFTKDELAQGQLIKKGEMFSITARNADIQRLTEKYQDLGYAFVNVIPKMKIKDEDRTVDIDYAFEKGNLVYFGKINISGNSKTWDKVIRRELRVNEGELYHGTNLRISRERVERLGYFAPGEVIFNTNPRKGRDDLVDLEITIKERSTGTITLGAGYGSLQGFFFTTQISEINLLGRGQNLSFSAQYSTDKLQRSLNLGFTDPYAFDTNWSLGFDVFSSISSIPNKYVLRKLGFNLRAGYPLSDDISAYVTYKNEGLQVADNRSGEDTSLDEGVLSSMVFSVVRDLRNNRFETSAGSYQSISIEPAGLGGDKKFLKWDLNARWYKRIVGDLVFRTNFSYGQIAKIAARDVPPTEKYFLGGPNNMRGFELFQLGPGRTGTNNTFIPLGGRVQMFSMSEFEYPLIREAGLKWVMFYDIGNSFEGFPGFNGVPFRLRQDAGFGLRWFSPIGPLRFEWGFPLDKLQAGESNSVFQFFIGPPF